MKQLIGSLSVCVVILFAACSGSSTKSEKDKDNKGSDTTEQSVNDNLSTSSGNEDETNKNQPLDRSNETQTSSEVDVEDGFYVLNKVKPKVTWAAEKLIGGGHNGTLQIEAGKFSVQNGNITEGLVVFDMARIAVSDLEGEKKDQLEGHLRSGDFFNVDEHPKATLNVNGVFMEGDENILNGTLEMNGVPVDYSIPVTLVEAKLPGEEIGLAIQGKFYLDRTKHNITYHSQSFDDNLDWFINDDVEVGFSVIGTLAK